MNHLFIAMGLWSREGRLKSQTNMIGDIETADFYSCVVHLHDMISSRHRDCHIKILHRSLKLIDIENGKRSEIYQ